MATTELTYFSFPIVKFEKNDDGDLIVMGKATDGSVDSDDQIVDSEWSAKALQDWHNSGGNVRVQHQALRDPAGKSMSIEIDRDGDSGHWVRSLVVEPVAKRLVEAGVLTAYSVGIARPVIRRDPTGKARGGIVAGGSLAEISLVDRPANKSCGLVMAKSEGGSVMELTGGELFGEPDFLAKFESDDVLTKAGSGPAEDSEPPAKPAKPAAGGDAGSSQGGASGQASEDDGQDGDDGDGGTDAANTDDVDAADAVSKFEADTRRDYRADRKEWLAREPAVKGAVGGTEYLKRRAAWLRWNAEGEGEGVDGSREGAMLWLAKRGGEPATVLDPDDQYMAAEAALFKRDVRTAERRQLAAEGKALADGSYPIANTADLGNAAHLARSGHGDHEAAKRLIARRAKELGVANPLDDNSDGKAVAPDEAAVAGSDAGKAGSQLAADGTVGDDGKPVGGAGDCPTCHGDGKIMGDSRTCPDCHGSGKMTAKAGAPDLPVEKRASCKGCGTKYDDDHPGKFCSNCGNKLPGMDKAGGAAEAGPDLLALADTVAKSVAAGLITQAAGDEIIAAAAAKSAATGGLPADARPSGTHREPDGTSTVEQLEPDAHLGTDPDATPDKVPSSVSSLGMGKAAPYGVLRMHDALCAAYDGGDVLDAYPSLKALSGGLDEAWLTAAMAGAATAGEARKTAGLAVLVDAVQHLKGADPGVLDDARAELRKSFTDMYPTEHIKPGAGIKPGSFQRPYLSAGHAAEDASSNGGDNIPPSAHTPEPEQFRRPLITAGHESDSPANKAGDIRNGAPVRTGASRTFYSNAQREAARVAMQAIHDHISGNFPDMCPMAASKSVLPPDMGARNIPVPATPAPAEGITSVKVDVTAPGGGTGLQQSIRDAILRHAARTTTAPVLDGPGLEAAAKAAGFELVKATNPGCGCCPDCKDMTGKTAGVDTQPAPDMPASLTADQIKALLTEAIDPYTDRLGQLQKQLENVASQPDPALAPVRGALAKAAPGPAAPVERRSLVDEAASAARAARDQEAADEQASYRSYITSLTKSPDPSVRERAITVLNKLDGPS